MKKFEIGLLINHLVYYGLLLGAYSSFIVVNYSYLGIKDSLNTDNIYFSIILIAAAVLMIRKYDAPSYFYLHLIVAMIVTPSLVMVSGSNLMLSFGITTWLAFACIALVVNFSKIAAIGGIRYINSSKLLVILSSASVAYIISIILFGGVRFINFDFAQVYEYRDAAADNLPSLRPL